MRDIIKKSKELNILKLKWGDFLIFAIIAVVVVVMFISSIMRNEKNALIAQISQNGELLYEINLDDLNGDKEILFHDGEVRIIAEKGRIRFEKSDCPDLMCVNTGWIKRHGQIAACLPNKILIKIIGTSDEVDVVLH